MIYRCSVPFRLKSENWYQRHHWSIRRRDIRFLAEHLRFSGVPQASGFRRVNVCFRFPKRRRRDATNYAGKVLEDAMVSAGLLLDDSPEFFEWGEIRFEQGEPGIELEFLESLRKDSVKEERLDGWPESAQCLNCGTWRSVEEWMVEECPNCGDPEYDWLQERYGWSLVERAWASCF